MIESRKGKKEMSLTYKKKKTGLHAEVGGGKKRKGRMGLLIY